MGRPPSQLWRGGGGLVLVNGFDYVRRSLTTSFNKKVSGTETFIFYCVCTHCTTLCCVLLVLRNPSLQASVVLLEEGPHTRAIRELGPSLGPPY